MLKFCGLGSVLLVVLLGDSRLTGMSLSVPFRTKAERSVPNVIPIAPRGTAGQAASSYGPERDEPKEPDVYRGRSTSCRLVFLGTTPSSWNYEAPVLV